MMLSNVNRVRNGIINIVLLHQQIYHWLKGSLDAQAVSKNVFKLKVVPYKKEALHRITYGVPIIKPKWKYKAYPIYNPFISVYMYYYFWSK